MAANRYTYGDTVKIRDDAPDRFRPGEIASVFSVDECDNDVLSKHADAELGEYVYGVEFKDGRDTQLAERWLDKT